MVMEHWDLWLHLVRQKGRVVGPGVGMEAWGRGGREPKDRMTVSAAQQLLGTQDQSSPARELPPQGKLMHM